MSKIIFISVNKNVDALVKKIEDETGYTVSKITSIADASEDTVNVISYDYTNPEHWLSGIKDLGNIEGNEVILESLGSEKVKNILTESSNQLDTEQLSYLSNSLQRYTGLTQRVQENGFKNCNVMLHEDIIANILTYSQRAKSKEKTSVDEVVVEPVQEIKNEEVEQEPEPEEIGDSEDEVEKQQAAYFGTEVEPEQVIEPVLENTSLETHMNEPDEVVSKPEEPVVETEPEQEPEPEHALDESFSIPAGNNDVDDFDPTDFDEAINNSLSLGDPAVEKIELEPEAIAGDLMAEDNETLPLDVPDVLHKVEILKSPLSDIDPESLKEPIYDYAGSYEDFFVGLKKINDKVEYSQTAKRRLTITPDESSLINANDDFVSNVEQRNFQYTAGAEWSQAIKTVGKNIPIITPLKPPKPGDSRYIGENSVAMIANRMKIGTNVGVFLPHTGIYFSIVSPEDGELIDTLSIINQQRVESLRTTSGILLGNSNYYLNRQVRTLFYNSIIDCSLIGHNNEILNELIDERDLGVMAAALAESIYPDGYDYVQICGLKKKNLDDVCHSEVRKLISIRRCIVVDNSRLTDYQRSIAAGGLKKRTIDEIKTYQEQHYIAISKAYEITPDTFFNLKAPRLEDSIVSGENWISEIGRTVDSLLAFRQDENERNVMINQRVAQARICEFTHWVNNITIDDLVIDDRDKIHKLMSRLGRNEKVLEIVAKAISDFQRKSIIAMVAVPRVQCETCKQTDQQDIEISQHLIPQDAVSRFFTLARLVL